MEIFIEKSYSKGFVNSKVRVKFWIFATNRNSKKTVYLYRSETHTIKAVKRPLLINVEAPHKECMGLL